MADSVKNRHSAISGRVSHSNDAGPVSHAEVQLFRSARTEGRGYDDALETTRTDAAGRFQFEREFEDSVYTVRCQAFGEIWDAQEVPVSGGQAPEAHLDLKLDFKIVLKAYGEQDTLVPVARAIVGRPIVLSVEWQDKARLGDFRWFPPRGATMADVGDNSVEIVFTVAGRSHIEVTGSTTGDRGRGGDETATAAAAVRVSEPEAQTVRGNLGINLQRTASEPTLDQALWVAIRNRTQAISFGRYRDFINRVLRWDDNDRLPDALERRLKDLGTHLHGVGAYNVLKTATEMFLLLECGVRIETSRRGESTFELEEQARLGEPITSEQIAQRLKDYLGRREQLPYITRVVEAAFPELQRATSFQDRVLAARINEPCMIELIWSYWHEEGMLMQTINAVSQRFQNIRRPGNRDPLANLEIDPLRPVNNLIWGYIQDEVNRLTVSRRAYEYLHEYGLAIYGKAAPNMEAADTRSKFLDAFHNLLHQASVFFKEDFQTTVIADGFPLLNSLREVHLILAQGAHNQFGDLPWTARTEMLLAQYMLARPEIRDFMQSRVMVPYKEAWMPQVDTMKYLQGWPDITVTHFRDLGVYGEQLLLSIRYGDWIDATDENAAKNWARYWRPEIQGYLHAYRATTGIDLTNPDTVDSTVPALLLQKRMAMQQRVR